MVLPVENVVKRLERSCPDQGGWALAVVVPAAVLRVQPVQARKTFCRRPRVFFSESS